MFLPEKLRHLADDLAVIDDPHERLTCVVDRARRRPPLATADRIDAHRIPGCISLAWVTARANGGVCQFDADADSPLVRGLLVCLADFFSGATPTEVAACDLDPLEHLGLTRELSPTRRHGLASARTRIRELARQLS